MTNARFASLHRLHVALSPSTTPIPLLKPRARHERASAICRRLPSAARRRTLRSGCNSLGANPLVAESATRTFSIVWRQRARQEVLWCAKRKIEKVIHIENWVSQRSDPARSPSSDCMSGLCLSRLSVFDKGASHRWFGLRLHR